MGLAVLLLSACGTNQKPLPILGERSVVRTAEGKADTIYQQIPDFSLLNQDSAVVDQKTIEGKIYVADFFFTSCPTICPRVRKNLKKVAQTFADEPSLLILSHSIDTEFDTVGRLAWYAERLEIDSRQWHLLHGNREQIYGLAKDYMITAVQDKSAPGGFDHSSYVALIDTRRRIRGLYDGLDPERMEQLLADIRQLLAEEFKK